MLAGGYAPLMSVGIYLGVVQFFFALCWTVYVAYLPQLAAQVGIAKSAVIWILMLDQLIFVLSDFAFGVASDRAAKVVGRIGRVVVAVTLLSCVAFLALPLVAPTGSAPLFLALVVLWSITSSALRAPPLTLIGRHAARPQVPWLVALSVFGLGVANAIAPYLTLHLRDIDPRVPFLLASVALALVSFGIVAAERALTKHGAPAKVPEAPPAQQPAVPGFLAAAVLAALAFQVHGFLNSGPQYLRFVSPDQLAWFAPVFWVGFNLALLPAGALARRFGAWRVMAAAALVAGVATWAAAQAPGLNALVAAQGIAGAAWGCLLMSAFSTALALGHTGREGRLGGALSSVLALAALSRMAVLAAGGHQAPDLRPWLAWAPVAGWVAAGVVLWWATRRRPA
jgi:MFS family permease